MRTPHSAHSLPAFPVYSIAFLSDDQLVLGGGGGAGRSGVKNKLRLYKLDGHKNLDLVDEFELARDEDAPMSMAAIPESGRLVCGVNSTTDKLEKGENENCRTFIVGDDKLNAADTRGTLTNGDVEDYQRLTAISPDGSLVAVAGARDLSVLTYPGLQPTASPIHVSQGEIYDATFSPTTLVIATTVNLLVYQLTTGSSEKGKERAGATALELVRTVERPALPGNFAGSNFRAARFHPAEPGTLYTVLNTVPPRVRTKSSPRVAFVCKWDTETWEVVKTRKIGEKGATCFDISADGKLLAYGSSDLSVGVVDSATLLPLVMILKAHDFPPTCIKFNPTRNLLVSGSADNSVRVVTIPDNIRGTSWQTIFTTILVAILVLILAIAAQMMYGPSLS